MADAMCGPANPLQQFKQHTNVDRTLQQDRLSSRFGPAQGFRSRTPQPTQLDHDFEAFQAGVEPAFLDNGRPHLHPGQMGGPVQAPSWANDFAALQISPQPVMQHAPQFQAGPSTSNWASAFRDQFAQSAPRTQMSSSPQAFQQRARFGLSAFQNTFQAPTFAQPSFGMNIQQSKGKEAVLDQFDDTAFERAFDQAREEMVLSDSAIPATDATLRTFEADKFDTPSAYLSRTSTIHQEPTQQETQEQNLHRAEDDALAQTAQELLEKVEHNQSEKFKNSQFLGLMRKLRDREMRVEGDKMVETSSTTSAEDDPPRTTANAPARTLQPMTSVTEDQFRGMEAATYPQPSDAWANHYAPQQEMSRDGQDVVNLLNNPRLAQETGPMSLPQGPSFEDDPYVPYEPYEPPGSTLPTFDFESFLKQDK